MWDRLREFVERVGWLEHRHRYVCSATMGGDTLVRISVVCRRCGFVFGECFSPEDATELMEIATVVERF